MTDHTIRCNHLPYSELAVGVGVQQIIADSTDNSNGALTSPWDKIAVKNGLPGSPSF